ncbi:tRNA (guanine-N(7)-)-methyltransferase [Gemella bergeri ATCC 700627]|uniref:tRNA (guanine-N(7)-)-methyltransferase n=1 Tax=Gemella bergeri ATCC 700627 TaxID=1321820 RepID=U2Q9U8_9BACL|nr:tRNA (guanosine(46)-N7)-methyltransferase TrmB [Gemella bergeri]ERK59595.1 tRNA (guanine-N(7)-)-methyltransferase [Gemella bergeri ATCC 700627]
MRVRNRSNSRERLENSPFVFLQPKDNKGKWKDIFGNNNPIHLEIGSGKGKFIHTLAEKYPNINFIAMEAQQTVLSFLLDKVEETYRDNLKLISGNAEDLLDYFAPFEISKLYLNFSDPWPKTRHEKRRLTFSKFLERYEIILNNKKTIVQKTDNQGLFEYSLMSFAKNNFTFEKISLDLTNSIYEQENVHTEYEDKFIQKGNRIYMVEAVKEN